MSLSFSRKQRLTTVEDYRRVLRSTFSVYQDGIILFAYKNNLEFARLGLIIAKREIPKAVNRNLIKRLIRERFRLNQCLFDPYDIVIMVKRKCLTKNRKEITNDLNLLWKKVYSGASPR